jgi:hypothetical protein
MAENEISNGQTQRDIGVLEGKMDMIIQMVGGLGQKLDDHLKNSDSKETAQNVAINKIDKRVVRIETKWAVFTAGLVVGVTFMFQGLLWVGEKLVQFFQNFKIQ